MEESRAGRHGFKKREMAADVDRKRRGKREGTNTDEEVKRRPGTPAFPTCCDAERDVETKKAQASYGGSPRASNMPEPGRPCPLGMCAQSSVTCRHYCLGV